MIHLADEEITKNWIKFQRDYFGKRFFYKGWIISKAAAFGLVERGEVKESDLNQIDSDYHKKIILV